jgi:hypothetical protein
MAYGVIWLCADMAAAPDDLGRLHSEARHEVASLSFEEVLPVSVQQPLLAKQGTQCSVPLTVLLT